MKKQLRAAAEIMAAIKEHGTIRPGTVLFRHLAFTAFDALTEREKEVFRMRYPGKPDPTCDCRVCETGVETKVNG